MATIFKPLGTWKPYYIPTGTEVRASDLRRARKVYRGESWGGSTCYKLASHKDDPTEGLYIWRVFSDGTALNVQDDADGLERAENEGIFEMRCDNLDLEGRVLMAEVEAEFG